MSDPLDRYSLQPARSAQEWAAYHAIRRDAIFAPLLPGQAYDERDPDEREPGNLPHVLVRDGEVVGTVRIDLIDATQAGLRLIGIRTDLQQQGHGAVLLALAEQPASAATLWCARIARRKTRVNALMTLALNRARRRAPSAGRRSSSTPTRPR